MYKQHINLLITKYKSLKKHFINLPAGVFIIIGFAFLSSCSTVRSKTK